MSFSIRRPARPPAARRTTRRRMNTIAQGHVARAIGVEQSLGNPARQDFCGRSDLGVRVVLYVFFGLDYFYVFNFNIVGAQYLTTAEIEKASGYPRL